MGSDSISTINKNIHDLTDVYEEQNSVNNQDVIVIDGRGYESVAGNKIEMRSFEDMIEDNQTANNLNKEIMKRVSEIAEKISREIIPGIAEKVIKEEIEKLKKMSSEG